MLTFFLLTIFNSYNERTAVCKDFLNIHFLIHVYMIPSVMCQIKTNNQMPTLFDVYLYFSPIFQISFVSRQVADQTICSTKQPPKTATLLAWLSSAKPLASAVVLPRHPVQLPVGTNLECTDTALAAGSAHPHNMTQDRPSVIITDKDRPVELNKTKDSPAELNTGKSGPPDIKTAKDSSSEFNSAKDGASHLSSEADGLEDADPLALTSTSSLSDEAGPSNMPRKLVPSEEAGLSGSNTHHPSLSGISSMDEEAGSWANVSRPCSNSSSSSEVSSVDQEATASFFMAIQVPVPVHFISVTISVSICAFFKLCWALFKLSMLLMKLKNFI